MALLPTARRALATRTAQKLDFRFYLFLHILGKMSECVPWVSSNSGIVFVR